MEFIFQEKRITLAKFDDDDEFLLSLITQLPTKSRVLEIGAFRGMFSNPILERFEKALIIEGEETNYAELIRSFPLHEKKIMQKQIYKDNGTHNWFFAEDFGSNAIRLPLRLPLNKATRMSKKHVKTVTLEEIDFNFDFMKTDCEGSDFPILQGATRLITKNKPLLYFEHSGEKGAINHNYTKDDFFNFFTEHAYKLYLTNGLEFTQSMWYTDTHKIFNSYNILAIPTELSTKAENVATKKK